MESERLPRHIKKDELPIEDGFVSTVNYLAKRTHQSKAEVLRDAVNLYYKAVNEWEKNGKGIGFQSTTDTTQHERLL